jgi:hypothetical protein
MKLSTLCTTLAVMGFGLIAVPAKADIAYTFIKLTCDKPSQAARINIFYDWNELGKARIAKHEKDTYYLDDISHDERKDGQEISCSLGKDKMLSIISSQSHEHPRNDNIEVLINHVSVLRSFEWPTEVEIKLDESGGADVQTCPLDSSGVVKKDKCEQHHQSFKQ